MKPVLLLLLPLAASFVVPSSAAKVPTDAAAADAVSRASLDEKARQQTCYDEFINLYLSQVDNIAAANRCLGYFYNFDEDECCSYIAIAYDAYTEVLETCGNLGPYSYYFEYRIDELGPYCKGEATLRPTPTPYPTPIPSDNCQGIIDDCISDLADPTCLSEEPDYACCGSYFVGSQCAYDVAYRYDCSDVDPYSLGDRWSDLYYGAVRCNDPPPATSPPDLVDTIAECYPGSATVEMSDGAVKRMNQLQLGDVVKATSGAFSEVYFFSHRKESGMHDFIRLASSETSDVLEVSPGHLVYANGKLVAANKVLIGDTLNRGDGSEVSVSTIEKVVLQGLYHPHTMQGDIVVNGFRTSGYTTAVAAPLAHVALAPLRALHALGVFVPQFLNDDAPRAVFSVVPGGSDAA